MSLIDPETGLPRGWDRPGGGPVGGDGFVRLSEVVEREVDWFWDGRIARASVAVVAGDGGVGKSTLAQELAARVTRGQAPPYGQPGPPQGAVILTAEEDPSAVVRPRMRLMGADLERVNVLNPEDAGLTLPSGAERLASRCRVEEAGIVVVDVGPAFLDRGLKSNNEEDVRAFIAPLRALAEELRLVVLILAHLNKDASRDSRRRVMGGSAWVNAPRHVLLVGPPPGANARETGERLVAVEKNNLGAYPPAIAFRLAPADEDTSRAIVAWGREVDDVQAADLVAEAPNREERSERSAAKDFLRAELDDGPRTVKELKQAASAANVAWRTLERAKSDLGVKASKSEGSNGAWRWALPLDQDSPSGKSASPRAYGVHGGVGGVGGHPHLQGNSSSSHQSPREGRQETDRGGLVGGLPPRPELSAVPDEAELERFEGLAAATDPSATPAKGLT